MVAQKFLISLVGMVEKLSGKLLVKFALGKSVELHEVRNKELIYMSAKVNHH